MDAVTRLDRWLTEGAALDFSDALDELREAVEHLAECNGLGCAGGHDNTACAEWEGADPEPCWPCEDCTAYREGNAGGWSRTRSVYALLDEVEGRDERLRETLEATA